MDRNTIGENEPVAVIGLACRVPGADHSERWWTNLVSGVDSVGPPSEARRRAAVPMGPQIPSEGGFLDSVADFDADFFGISQREAPAMDPQQRLALELAWEAMEDAGIVPAALTSLPVGVYLGSSSDDYALLLSRSGHAVSHHAMTGLQRGVIANRVSHHLGVRGPSLLIDTGQSSSLVAVHLAVASLRSGECRMAVAGGVNLALAPESQLAAARMGVLSPTGRCRVFDRAADGFVRGEGGGVVVLKPLSSALADGDRVYCVIRGTAVNHDGAGEDLAAPDGAAQAGLLASAHRSAGVTAADVQYVELHGTGTPAGDATEAAALREVFGDRDTALTVGSVKTNIGHLEGAAGVAGLIKTVLSLHHRALPPNLHFTAPPDRIPLAEWGLRVQTETSPWPDPASPLIAGVSSFGMGGTNCHVVLAAHDSPEPPAEAGTTGPLPYVLSARTPTALAATARALREHRAARPDVRDVDVAFTLATGRTAHACRAVGGGRGAPPPRHPAAPGRPPPPPPAAPPPAARAGPRAPTPSCSPVSTGSPATSPPAPPGSSATRSLPARSVPSAIWRNGSWRGRRSTGSRCSRSGGPSGWRCRRIRSNGPRTGPPVSARRPPSHRCSRAPRPRCPRTRPRHTPWSVVPRFRSTTCSTSPLVCWVRRCCPTCRSVSRASTR
ncbi:beta-ketoacyl synthase N-terminal-like domain-containing protein [Saccharomonospora xinjiangensis]